MGRVPLRHPPRHLALPQRSRMGAREHYAAEWILAAVAIVLRSPERTANDPSAMGLECRLSVIRLGGPWLLARPGLLSAPTPPWWRGLCAQQLSGAPACPGLVGDTNRVAAVGPLACLGGFLALAVDELVLARRRPARCYGAAVDADRPPGHGPSPKHHAELDRRLAAWRPLRTRSAWLTVARFCRDGAQSRQR